MWLEWVTVSSTKPMGALLLPAANGSIFRPVILPAGFVVSLKRSRTMSSLTFSALRERKNPTVGEKGEPCSRVVGWERWVVGWEQEIHGWKEMEERKISNSVCVCEQNKRERTSMLVWVSDWKYAVSAGHFDICFIAWSPICFGWGSLMEGRDLYFIQDRVEGGGNNNPNVI